MARAVKAGAIGGDATLATRAGKEEAHRQEARGRGASALLGEQDCVAATLPTASTLRAQEEDAPTNAAPVGRELRACARF